MKNIKLRVLTEKMIEDQKKWALERYGTDQPIAVIKFLLQEINHALGVGSGKES